MKKNLLNILFVLGLIAFWGIRVYYWINTQEAPFSDMANFDAVAHNIISSGSFAWDNFWQSYTTPTLVTLRAIQVYLTGDSLLYWQIFQGLINFIALLWLIFEIQDNTKEDIYSVALIWVVALSRSSIFWSYKLAREGLAEGLIYACAAATLWAFRQPKFGTFFWTGVIYMVTIFNRPNFIFLLPIFYLLIILNYYWKSRDVSYKLYKQFFAFSLGFLLIWTPWIARNYYLYHAFLPLATQGGNSFLWELGAVDVVNEDGIISQKTVKELQGEADRFANDYEYYVYTQDVAKNWLSTHWQEYPLLVAKRMYLTAANENISLTQVSRTDILPGDWDKHLPDRSLIVIIIGLIGWIIFTIKKKEFIILPFIIVFSWFTAALFISYPRMLEPSIPLLIYGNILLVITIIQYLLPLLKRDNTAKPATGAVDRAAILSHETEE